MLHRHQGRVGCAHTTPKDALILNAKELKGVKGSLHGVLFPGLPLQMLSQIDSLFLLVENLVKDKVSALKAVYL